MIIGDLAHWRAQPGAYPAVIGRALALLAEQPLAGLACGRYPLGQDGMMLLIQELHTAPADTKRPEAHTAHADIQLLLAGHERYGVAFADGGEQVLEDRLASHDIAFYAPPARESFIDLVPGMFLVFLPGELHRPCCASGEATMIRKAVVKVPRQLL
ncbi:YhcH/YjgK/YiaL family protein [Chitiniphilus purpureus]|uniref:YhcH/YjgK/YiaL family protein n=1 Tax=Chitiniphilus purpureus TaxID=2981137 RepID=A0ABY6DHR5_9NEIS|nr:YhcH/YjgK/YiaL family protein [Chitiniphilus sp. CD1]UXY13884.1 YhcH/YjgK/YiaL family protein [Chitiniphilus sp. CD1]